MLQLLCHLVGDYILQTNWMADNKTKRVWPAIVHAFVYTIGFAVVLHPSFQALLVISITHFFIDHYRLARYVIFAKNWLNEPHLKWRDCSKTGYLDSAPPWLSVWLLIIADNTMHLCINYAAIYYL